MNSLSFVTLQPEPCSEGHLIIVPVARPTSLLVIAATAQLGRLVAWIDSACSNSASCTRVSHDDKLPSAPRWLVEREFLEMTRGSYAHTTIE